MKTVCIHQPDFLPYLGFFHRLLTTDHFIYLDDVQFIRRGWQHRDQIKTRDGVAWLTLSIQKGHYHQQIREVLLSTDDKWVEDNLNLIRQAYAKSKYFNDVFPLVQSIYQAGHARMLDFNLAFLNLAFVLLDINVQTSLSSELNSAASSTRRLVDLVTAVQGKNYLTGNGSRDYLDESLFNKAGINVIWQNFKHPVYPQLHGDFVPMLSCLDLFFNCGSHSGEILRESVNG
jgi:hypothetical protein